VKKFKRMAATPQSKARRVLRQEVDWPTRYTLEGSHSQPWRECRVRDLSRNGAGVELFDTTVDEARGHRVVVEIELPPATFRLVGDVRHAAVGTDGGVHVGLRFASLSAVERDMLDAVLGRDSNAPSAQ